MTAFSIHHLSTEQDSLLQQREDRERRTRSMRHVAQATVQWNVELLHSFDFNSCFSKNSHIRSLAETFDADLPSVAACDFRPGQV